jgi:hypothetical protein
MIKLSRFPKARTLKRNSKQLQNEWKDVLIEMIIMLHSKKRKSGWLRPSQVVLMTNFCHKWSADLIVSTTRPECSTRCPKLPKLPLYPMVSTSIPTCIAMVRRWSQTTMNRKREKMLMARKNWLRKFQRIRVKLTLALNQLACSHWKTMNKNQLKAKQQGKTPSAATRSTSQSWTKRGSFMLDPLKVTTWWSHHCQDIWWVSGTSTRV